MISSKWISMPTAHMIKILGLLKKLNRLAPDESIEQEIAVLNKMLHVTEE